MGFLCSIGSDIIAFYSSVLLPRVPPVLCVSSCVIWSHFSPIFLRLKETQIMNTASEVYSWFNDVCFASIRLSRLTRLCEGWFLADEDFWEGWTSVLVCSLVAAESDSWCAHSTALWTDEGFGSGWLVCCSLFLPPAFFLCGFMPLCLEPTTGLFHLWAPTVVHTQRQTHIHPHPQ